MAKKYTYKGKEYTSVNAVRQAIWSTEYKAFGKEPSENIAEFWSNLGVQYEEYTVTTKPVETSIDTLKTRKLKELETKFNSYRESKDIFITSSLGFTANCNTVAFTNVDGLIAQLEIDPSIEVIPFMGYDNIVHNLNEKDLKVLKAEISKNGSYVYQQKWSYKEQINACTTKEELDALKFTFTCMKFSSEE